MKKIPHILYYYLILGVLCISPFSAWGAGTCTTTTGLSQRTFKCVVDFFADMINKLVIVIIGLGLLVFLWGLLKYIIAGGDEDKIKEARQFIVFGLIAFFIMLSVWGLVNLLVHTFFPGGNGLIIPQVK